MMKNWRGMTVLALLGLCALSVSGAEATLDGRLDKIKTLTRSARERKMLALKSAQEAYAALDRAEYDTAVASHKKVKPLEAEAAELEKKATVIIEEIVTGILPELNSDKFAVREQALAMLPKLGRLAAPILKRVAEKSMEAQSRLMNAAKLLEENEEDDAGRLHQWASGAAASSEFGPQDWSATQATGKPNTLIAGDNKTAWASLDADGIPERLQLSYDKPVHLTAVRVHETYNPGAVSKVEAYDVDGKWHTVWEGKDATPAPIGWFKAVIDPPAWSTRLIKITIDNAAVAGWNEIDAVELIGVPAVENNPGKNPIVDPVVERNPAMNRPTAVPHGCGKVGGDIPLHRAPNTEIGVKDDF